MSAPQNFRSATFERGYPLGLKTRDVYLTSDGQAIEAKDDQLIRLYSDSTTATARTFSLLNGTLEGQTLVLIQCSGGSTACEFPATTYVELASTKTFAADGSIWLYWDGAVWHELSRRTN